MRDADRDRQNKSTKSISLIAPYALWIKEQGVPVSNPFGRINSDNGCFCQPSVCWNFLFFFSFVLVLNSVLMVWIGSGTSMTYIVGKRSCCGSKYLFLLPRMRFKIVPRSQKWVVYDLYRCGLQKQHFELRWGVVGCTPSTPQESNQLCDSIMFKSVYGLTAEIVTTNVTQMSQTPSFSMYV